MFSRLAREFALSIPHADPFKYDVFDMTLTNDDTIGVSNELREEEGLISIKKGYLLVFETKD